MSSKFSLFNLHSHQNQNPNNHPGVPTPPGAQTYPPSGDNIFKAFSNDPPPIATRPDHPVPKTAIRSRSKPVSDTQLTPLLPAGNTPLETNKFYSNLFLGGQSSAAWSQPYSLWWSKGRGNAQSWGMSVTHIERDGIAYGPMNAHNACNFFFGPVGRLCKC
jgi:endo-1,3(4)-beta-glucanase